jgi:cytochrome c oxidase subunit 3
MWAFLVTEVLFFGGVLSAFAVFQTLHPEAMAAAAHHLSITWGTINTVILLLSSLSMAFAVHFAQLRDRQKTIKWLFATLGFGAIFLGIKAYEWYVDYQEGFVPMRGLWNPHQLTYEREIVFWSFYFTLTGLHAIHMIIGMVIILIMAGMVWRNWFSGCGATQIEMMGLYWHFVDIVWVFLFPILYLINNH